MNKGYKKEDLTDSVLMSFYLEYETRDWLREQALKRRTTMGSIIRNLISQFKKKN